MPTISKILNPAFKSGTSKTGKPWVLMQIEVEDKPATIFAPAAVGDEVIMKFNDQFQNWNAEKVTQKSSELSEIHQKLDKIIGILEPGLPLEEPGEPF